MGCRREQCKFGPETALNDGRLQYVIKLRSERKLNCPQQTESEVCGIQISRRFQHGKATAASGSLSEMRCRRRTYHRAVRIAADSVSALRRLRAHIRDARIGVVGQLAPIRASCSDALAVRLQSANAPPRVLSSPPAAHGLRFVWAA